MTPRRTMGEWLQGNNVSVVDKVSIYAEDLSGTSAFKKDQRERLLGPRQKDANESEGRMQTFVGQPLRNDKGRVLACPWI
ncbi:hypothetical protein TNCV_4925101 [Trichonephila clavipes]|nr:hypothetical protein TNCV_4925101 [Trichonephila clavipes]